MTAGVFGKLPAFADFVSRQLPGPFVEQWAGWLEPCLHRAREATGPAWQEAYLSAPVWCFSLDAEVLGPAAWCGVMATSVDSLGRYYPLTLANALAEDVPAFLAAEVMQSRLRRMEEMALGLVDGSLALDDVLGELAGLADGSGEGAVETLSFRNRYGSEVGSLVVHPSYPAVTELRSAVRKEGGAATAWRGGSARATFWWHYGWPGRRPEAIRFRGLPDPDAFPAFIDGAWTRHGWQG